MYCLNNSKISLILESWQMPKLPLILKGPWLFSWRPPKSFAYAYKSTRLCRRLRIFTLLGFSNLTLVEKKNRTSASGSELSSQKWGPHITLKFQLHWLNFRSKVAGKLSAEQTMQNVCLTEQFFLKGKCLNLNTVLSKQQKSPFKIVQLCVLTTWVHLSAPIALFFSLGGQKYVCWEYNFFFTNYPLQ